MGESEDRSRGILTKSDRNLLRGNIELKNQQQYSNRRHTIRNRIANGLLDFTVIRHLLKDKDRKRIFRDVSREAATDEVSLNESIRDLLYWVYLGMKEQNYHFEGTLTDAIEEAEEDYALNYWGQSAEVTVQFDVDVSRSYDLDGLIDRIESGGPIQANRLYDLLRLPRGVPIDTSELSEVRVWFQSSYVEGEKEVLEALFSEYLNVDVDIIDAEKRVEYDTERDSAVISPEQSSPEPSEIKNYSPSFEADTKEAAENIRPSIKREMRQEKQNNADNEHSILESAIDGIVEQSENSNPSIHDIIAGQDVYSTSEDTISPEAVKRLLEKIRDPFVSTQEIAAAFECPSDAAYHTLIHLTNENKIDRHTVIGNDGDEIEIWWISKAEGKY